MKADAINGLRINPNDIGKLEGQIIGEQRIGMAVSDRLKGVVGDRTLKQWLEVTWDGGNPYRFQPEQYVRQETAVLDYLTGPFSQSPLVRALMYRDYFHTDNYVAGTGNEIINNSWDAQVWHVNGSWDPEPLIRGIAQGVAESAEATKSAFATREQVERLSDYQLLGWVIGHAVVAESQNLSGGEPVQELARRLESNPEDVIRAMNLTSKLK